MKYTALPLRVEHHHIQDGGGIVKSKIYSNEHFLFEILWNEDLADLIVRACDCHEELVEALRQVEPMASTLMDETTGKKATKWGIVNDCLVAVKQALANATK